MQLMQMARLHRQTPGMDPTLCTEADTMRGLATIAKTRHDHGNGYYHGALALNGHA